MKLAGSARWLGWGLALWILGSVPIHLAQAQAQTENPAAGSRPWVDEAAALPDGSSSALKAMAGLRFPGELKIELFAAEPKLSNPVAFCLDEQGRLYVAEEYRFNRGAEENRTRPFFLEDDLRIGTIDDRLAMYRKHAKQFEGGMEWFSKHSDLVRMLEDSDGDGKADRSTVFAGGFNDPLDGLAAGAIARDGAIYITCIPSLWLLRDRDGDGKADERTSLHRGFGVNCAFLGHDLHGLAWGPDGKLYFSVGDRGYHVQTKEGKTLSSPRRGAVFRCEPDGRNLEVVAFGMRNPQELAFDRFGNLFAADNNCDKGDHARLVYVLEGGDTGWNMAYQTIPEPYLTGPWHAERLWHLPHEGQAAWIVPPVGKIGTGPSGFAFGPGLGLPDRYRDHFFLCNYAGNGGIETFALKAQGAGFEIVDYQDFLKPINATDLEFGYDGKVYVSDFVNLQWDGGANGGRIYTLSDPVGLQNPAIAQTRDWFKAGFANQTSAELLKRLSHPDQRVRLRSQYALAERGDASAPALAEIAAKPSSDLMARLHAIWGLGQIGRTRPHVLKPLVPLLGDPEMEVRANAAKVLGDERFAEAADALIPLLSDVSPRVRLASAIAIGKLGHRPALKGIQAMIEENGDRDPFLRHGGVFAILGMSDPEAVERLASSPHRSSRLAALLVQRRTGDPRIVRSLNDPDPFLAIEAARAIHDVPIESGYPALAAVLPKVHRLTTTLDLEPLIRRAINAHFRLGSAESARAVAAYASDPSHPARMRREAMEALIQWAEPGPRDRVTGVWRPVSGSKRDPALVRQAIGASLDRLLSDCPNELLSAAVQLAAQYDPKANDRLLSWLKDRARPVEVRRAALERLAARNAPSLADAVQEALTDPDPKIRGEATRALVKLDAGRALRLLARLLEDPQSPTVEKQAALTALGEIPGAEADELIADWAERLADGRAPETIRLDVLEIARPRIHDRIRQALRKRNTGLPANDPVAAHLVSLRGGDAERGRAIFQGHPQGQCVRCHQIDGQGGTAGPDLSHVASRMDRVKLLTSLIVPDAEIAQGFGNVSVVLESGAVVAGAVKEESDAELTLQTADNQVRKIPKSEIEERTAPKSPMPPVGSVLTPRELRDLVEYLTSRK